MLNVNEVEEPERDLPGWQMLWQQFNDFVIYLLLIAALISALLGDWVEAAAIMAIVILNAVLGVIQERRAEEALAALNELAAPEANVLREGRRMTIPARELVPGDLVFLEAGNYVPADVRLTTAVNLRVDEAALTGESIAVLKDAGLVLEADAGEVATPLFKIGMRIGHGIDTRLCHQRMGTSALAKVVELPFEEFVHR